jgi:hypothetical protein
MSQRQPNTPNGFVAARAYEDPPLTVFYTTAAVEPAQKFYVFHQRHLGKSANIDEYGSPTENAMIATSHSQENACVVGKAVRKSINQAARQADSEVTSNDLRIIHDAVNLIQTSLRDFSVDVHEPKHVAAGSARAGVHLHRPIGLASNKLIAKPRGEINRVIGASAVSDNNLSSGRSLPQMLKKWSYQRRLVENWNDHRELHFELNLCPWFWCVQLIKTSNQMRADEGKNGGIDI